MSNGLTFAEYVEKKISEAEEDVPDHVREAADNLIEFERRFGTEAIHKMVEKAVMEEISSSQGDDHKYIEFLLDFIHGMKRNNGQMGN